MFADIATIDGPPASGKTTMASILAKEFSLTHLDSGSIFRTITLYSLRNGINLADPNEIIRSLNKFNLKLFEEKIFLDGVDVSLAIRNPVVTKNVCFISNIPAVRKFVKETQLSVAKSGKVICDGRKVGIEVFPEAKVKFYLTADQDARATRRFLELFEVNPKTKFDDVYNDLKKREETEIENGILRIPPNAIVIDNTHMNIHETFLLMKTYMK